ncbi:MAG: universal stress protein [Vicinamibacterales bacterium]
MELRHILCPIDFSEYSEHALSHAAALARWYGSRLTLMHVWTISPAPIPSLEPTLVMPALPEQQTRIAEALNEMATPLRDSGLKVSTAISEGSAVHEVIGLATADAADLIVMGTHGRGGFERFVLGSVTEKVLRKAPCPVLTVPRAVSGEAVDRVHYKRILCPVDAPSSTSPELASALSLAKETDAQLTLLHVVEPIRTPPGLTGIDTYAYETQLEADWRTRLHGVVGPDVRTWCRIDERVVKGRAAVSILDLATEVHAEIIVMGVQGRGTLDLLLFGSTTHQVVRQASCPVWTIRAKP